MPSLRSGANHAAAAVARRLLALRPASLHVLPPPVALMQTMMDSWLAQALYVVTKLGVPDRLADGAQTSEQLAAATGAHAGMLDQVLRALASFGYLRESDGTFALTRRSRPLVSDSPDSVQPAIVMWGEPFNWSTFGAMLHAVRTGERAFDHVFGTGVFEYLEADPEANRIYNEGMTVLARHGATVPARQFDYGRVQSLVDVGGGVGTNLATILADHPHLRGVLFDLPHVVADARPVLEAAGVMDRCEIVGGSFFESVPEGHDAYLFTTVIHDWDDAHAARILETCRRAIPDRGRLLLAEVVLPEDAALHLGRLADLQVMVMHGASERTREQFRQLLDGAGFRIATVTPSFSPMSLIEAVPVAAP